MRSFVLRHSMKTAWLPLCVLLAAVPAAQAQLSLYSAVDLARRNSASVRIAQADVERAQAGVSESRDAYIPVLSVGSSLGYSYGFPVGQPTLFNAQAQSLVFSFSQPDYIRAARAALHSATLNLQNAMDQVELDSALDYLQLDTISRQLAALDEQKADAIRLDSIELDRVSAGVESQIAATRAELTAAQADLKRLDLNTQAAVLREQLGSLTGLPPDNMQPESSSIPGDPQNVTALVPNHTAGVDAAFSNALSKHYIAHGDSRQNFRPQIGLGINYQRFASFNNYQSYYLNFQSNNFGAGLQVTFPLFNASNNAKARESSAQAVHADVEAELGRQQVDENIVRLEKSLPELRAQSHIANLQEQLASQQLQSVLLQLQQPPTNPNAAPLTPSDEMEARIDERGRYSDALDARFTLLKAELSLLRATGHLDSWINQAAR
jgi:outer membrane protein TolC